MKSLRLVCGVVAAALVILTGCGEHPFGDENSFNSKFEMVVENQSEEVIYVVRGRPGDERAVDGVWFGVLPGGTDRRGLGGRAAQNEPRGGCFDDQQVWIVESRSGKKYLNGQHDDIDDDLEILVFFPADTCVDTDEFIYTWSGPTTP